MATRRIRFVARGSKNKTATLDDGRTVKANGIVEVDVREAARLLTDPGAIDDSKAEWVPVARKDAE